MKATRIAGLFSLILLASIPTFAQSPSTGQWGIVATSESDKNTIDGGALQFITDWTTTTAGSKTTIAPVLVNTFTNSNCSASGQPTGFTVTYNGSKATIVVTVDDGQTITFAASGGGSSEFKGSFTSTGGGCTQADKGNFTATLYQPLQGSLSGTIESYEQTNTIDVTVTLDTASNFDVTGTVTSTDKTCMANLTINGTAAQAFGPSFASGDTITMFASDNSGDVVAFEFSATDQNGDVLSPAWPSQAYVTYYVVAGPCSGDMGTDAPFKHVQQVVTHAPIRTKRMMR